MIHTVETRAESDCENHQQRGGQQHQRGKARVQREENDANYQNRSDVPNGLLESVAYEVLKPADVVRDAGHDATGFPFVVEAQRQVVQVAVDLLSQIECDGLTQAGHDIAAKRA